PLQAGAAGAAPAARPAAAAGAQGGFAAPAASDAAAELSPAAAKPAGAAPSVDAARDHAAPPLSGAAQEDASGEHWLPRLIKSLGIEHEHQLSRMPDSMTAADASAAARDAGAGSVPPGAASAEHKAADTLKSVLMQLSQADDVPQALKETAQQAVQQITGQQLLLSSDRSSMFTHITLFVPLLNANGEQTAAIHIQSRKGRRGEIDARNCRLVFDLNMKALGNTMVDVQVVDRIVSLHVMNDQPFLQGLLEENREEIASGLSGIGYQFISLKCGPYPEKAANTDNPAPTVREQSAVIPAMLQAFYGKKSYRGMDVRV
ncbi:hypothetical protein N0M98_17395, partial [Paenibacillus doosanensis]|nr:hypothetical protein [Paenibacillus doosanensis]